MQRIEAPPVCGAHLEADGRCLWRVWAPRAKRVELVLSGRGDDRLLTMRPVGRGYFEVENAEIVEGQRYAFRLDGKDPRPDPASRWQPEGVHAASAVFDPRLHAWTDTHWKGVPRTELAIYELHVGTFTPEGTFDAIVPRLPELFELGVTAIELLPINQFPGHRDWGYDGVQWSAVQNTYGGPRALQQLVDAAHRAGLAVILDVVHNHLGPEGNYLPEFGPYFSNRFRTPWGEGINYDDGGSDAIRGHVLASVRRWFRDFHVDGLRLDAIHAIHDISPRHLLSEIKAAADDEAAKLGWPAHVIGESDLNDVRILRGECECGHGLDAQWSDDFHHCVHCLLTGEHDGYYVDYPEPMTQLVKVLNESFAYDGCYSPYRDRRHGAPAGDTSGERFVGSLQTHDQVGNRARGERLHQLVGPAQQRLAAGLLLLAPHTPMLFMGEEYGETRPFLFFCDFSDKHLQDAIRRGRMREFATFHWQGAIPDPNDPATFEKSKLSWSWPAGSHQAGLRQLYCDLLAARRIWPALRDFRHRHASLLPSSTTDHCSVLRLQRGPTSFNPQPEARGIRGAAFAPGSGLNEEQATATQHTIVAYFNLSPELQKLPADHPPHLLLRSEIARYGGSGESSDQLAPWEFIVFGTQPGATP